MKKILFLFSVTSFFVGCKGEFENTYKPVSDPITASVAAIEKQNTSILEYQSFPSHVQYANPQDQYERNQFDEFVKLSGLPLISTLSEWQNTHYVQDAIHLYKKHLSANKGSQFENAFRQYGSYLILSQLNLIGKGKDKANDIAFFVQEIISSQSNSVGLVYYSLKRLEDAGYDKTTLSEYAANFAEFYKPLSENLKKVQEQANANGQPELKRTLTDAIEGLEKEESLFSRLKSDFIK